MRNYREKREGGIFMPQNVISLSGAGVHENLPALVTTSTIGGQYHKYITILTSHSNVRYPIISLG